jgi:hypothetical protein
MNESCHQSKTVCSHWKHDNTIRAFPWRKWEKHKNLDWKVDVLTPIQFWYLRNTRLAWTIKSGPRPVKKLKVVSQTKENSAVVQSFSGSPFSWNSTDHYKVVLPETWQVLKIYFSNIHLCFSSVSIWSRDSVVGIATGYGLDGRVAVPGRSKKFLFYTFSRPTLDSTQPPIQWVRGALSRM